MNQPSSTIPWQGFIFAFLTTLIWSGNYIVARGLGTEINPATLALLRWTTALALLAPFATIQAWRERRIILAHKGYFFWLSLTGVTVFNTLVYLAGRTTGATNLALIAVASPIFIIIFARIFFNEAITPARLGGLVIALSGVLLLITKADIAVIAGLQFTVGDLWMLLAAIIFAAYSVLIRKKPPEISNPAFLMATFLPGLIMLLPWAGLEIAICGWPDITLPIAGSVLYVGLGASLAAYFMWNRAIAEIGPARAGVIYYSLPLFSGLEAWLILGEPITAMHLMGGALIIGGIVLASKR